MLSSDGLLSWFQRLNTPEQTRTTIDPIRSSGPSRRVGGGRSNVSGRYPSKKMGVTIQFESHGGREFESTYFETLLARYQCTKKTRPPAEPRFGSTCERLFGAANTQFIHNLRGNTQITRNVRQVTKAVDPKGLATWPLSDLHGRLWEPVQPGYARRRVYKLGLRNRWGTRVSRNGLSTIMNNPFYIGLIRFFLGSFEVVA